jgi:hypothetical protein
MIALGESDRRCAACFRKCQPRIHGRRHFSCCYLGGECVVGGPRKVFDLYIANFERW